MKRLIFHLRNPTDEGRVDVIEVREGAVLHGSHANTKYTQLVNVSQLVRVELVEDEEAPDAV